MSNGAVFEDRIVSRTPTIRNERLGEVIMPQGILVIAEQVDAKFRKVTYEVTSEGRRLADASGQPLTAVVVGAGIESIAAELASFGADKVLAVDHPD